MAYEVRLIRVTKCADLTASKTFYEKLGLVFTAEKHGDGPEHWFTQIGYLGFELYPADSKAKNDPLSTVCVSSSEVWDRLKAEGHPPTDFGGFSLIDPDGNRINVIACP